jgi:hypothetical protein
LFAQAVELGRHLFLTRSCSDEYLFAAQRPMEMDAGRSSEIEF